jgi:hypothetical protein
MAVSKCSHCRGPFWNYQPSPTPRGYCSQVCFDGRKHKRANPKDEDLQRVTGVISEMRNHYRVVHGSSDLTEWFDCEDCQRLDRRKVDALAEVA